MILNIGHIHILLPNESGVQTIMKALGKGVLVWDRLWEGKVEIKEEELQVEFKTVPANTRFVGENDQPVQTKEKKAKRLGGTTLLLENGARDGMRLF